MNTNPFKNLFISLILTAAVAVNGPLWAYFNSQDAPCRMDCCTTTVAYYNLGLAYFRSGMYEEAIEAFKQATRVNPDDADAHANLGLAYFSLGVYEEAIEE